MAEFTTTAVMGMVDQVLPGMVREKLFDFNACAREIESEFGVVMTVEEIRLAFAKHELQRTTMQESVEYDKHAVENLEESESSSESESDGEDYRSYPNRFGNRQQRQQQQQRSSATTSAAPAGTSSWLSSDQNQQESKGEEKDASDSKIPRAPTTSTNTAKL